MERFIGEMVPREHPPRKLAAWYVRGILLLVAGVILSSAGWRAWPSHDQGDGLEYLAMSEAILSHGTPDIRESDIQTILSHNVGAATDINTTKISGAWLRQMKLHTPRGIGIYLSRTGRFYSYHFWLYSLINVPALAVVQAHGWPLYSSLLITNCVLLFGLFAFIIFTPPWRLRRTILLAAMALAGGSTFYLGWTGPETMCFAFLLAGLVLLEMRRFGWALLAFAIAAQQNPPIGLLAVAAGACGCWKAWMCWRDTQLIAPTVRHLASLVPGTLILIASPVFYWIEFGTPNLIVAAGFTDASLMSGIRLASVFFDLNQGMVIAIPGVFVVVAVLLLYGVWRRSHDFWAAVGLLLAAVAMTVPVLSALNWNSGAVVITRYAYWLSAPVIYACALLADSMRWYAFVAVGCILTVSQSVVLGDFGLLGNRGNYLTNNRVAAWVFDHLPSWYAPVPEMFAERAVHREGVLNDGMVFFYVHQGHASIILASALQAAALSAICSLEPRRTKHVMSEQRWEYFYPGNQCPISLQDGFYSIPVPPPGWTGGSVAQALARHSGKAGPISYYHASLSVAGRPTVSADGKSIIVTVEVINNGVAPFGSAAFPHTVNLGAHSIDAEGNIVINDLARAALPSILLPGTSTRISISLPISTTLGYRVELLPVQEGVAWFDQWGTKPLIVGPFRACAIPVIGEACDASGKPLMNATVVQ